MGVAKPKEGAGLYAKGVLDKIFRERTGKEVKAVKRELLSEVAMGLIPGAGIVPKIARQKAVRGVVRGFLEHISPLHGREAALRAAKPHVGAIGRLPQELLDQLEKIEVKRLPSGTRARYSEFIAGKEVEAAEAAGRPLSTAKVAKREIYLDPKKAVPSSVYHEVGHLTQRVTEDPAIKRLLKPVAREYAERTSGRVSSLTEKHAREFSLDMLDRLKWERSGKMFSKKELDKIIKFSLENVLKGRTP